MTLLAQLRDALPERYYLGLDVGYKEHVAVVISLETFVRGSERWKRAHCLHFSSTQAGLWLQGAYHPLSLLLPAFAFRRHASQLQRWAIGDPDVRCRALALPSAHPRRVGRPAYFNHAFLGFVRDVLHASVNVVYNLRRQGKRFLATLFFVRQWRDLMSPRAHIERHFAWLKRYFGLRYFRVQGYFAVIQFVLRVYIAALIVAFIAARYERPELATSRLKVLAFVNT